MSLSLPVLLAGPIVRRASRDAVWIWCATSRKPLAAYGTLTRRGSRGEDRGGIELRSEPQLLTVALGTQLFASLLKFEPKAAVEPHEFVGYDFSLDFGGGAERSLEWLIETDKPGDMVVPIRYEGWSGPVFRMPAANARIGQGSCRRPGATGADAFLGLDAWFGEHVTERPQALFLTGDQIYADDVAGQLFAAIRTLAPELLGADEEIPVDGGGTRRMSAIKESRRDTVCHNVTGNEWGFTTQDGQRHLLGFSEFAAMYVLVWNPVLCRQLGVDQGDDENLAGFSEAVAKARRVMAHVATYMIFDDHEVTDDWNFNALWKKTNEAHRFTRRIIANAMAAYWAFQAWGNDPGSFDDAFRNTVEKHLASLANNEGKSDAAAAKRFEETLLKDRRRGGVRWSFFAPTVPPALCIDTRTGRAFPSDGSAILAGPHVLRDMSTLAREAGLRHGTRVLLLVLAGPLLAWNPAALGQSLMRRSEMAFGGPLTARGVFRRFGALRSELDYEFEEFWNNPDGIFAMAGGIAAVRPKACVIFSGDVHFSYVVDAEIARLTGDLFWGEPRVDYRVRLLQITSSAMKNFNSAFKSDWSSGTLGEALAPKGIDETGLYEDGFYTLAGRAVRLRNGRFQEVRTSLPRNNVCLVRIRSRKVEAHYIAADTQDRFRYFSQEIAL
jgi:hypothetical protein